MRTPAKRGRWGERLCHVPGGRLPGWQRGSRSRCSGLLVLSCLALRLPSADLWFLRLPVRSLQPASLRLAGLVFVTAVKTRLKCPAASPSGSKGASLGFKSRGKRRVLKRKTGARQSRPRVTLGRVRGACPPSALLTLFAWTCDRPSHQFPVTLSPCFRLHDAGSTLFSSSLRSYLVCCLSHHQSVPLQTCIFVTKSIFFFSKSSLPFGMTFCSFLFSFYLVFH